MARRLLLLAVVAAIALSLTAGDAPALPPAAHRPAGPHSLTPTLARRWFGEALTGLEAPQTPQPVLALEPAGTRPGGLVWVKVSGARGIESVTIDTDLPLWAGTLHHIGGGAEGFLGLDSRVRPGSYEIRVSLHWDADITWSGMAVLEVAPFAFPVQYLTVSPQLLAVRSPDLWEEDRPHFERGRDSSHPVPLWEGEFIMPVHGRISTEFGLRRFINGVESGRHNGIDIAADTGTPILATARGVVTLAMSLNVTGKTVFIDHGVGLFSVYYHLDRIDVAEGEMVDAGQTIGTVGSTGFSTGPHLHLGFSVWDRWIDPWLVLGTALAGR